MTSSMEVEPSVETEPLSWGAASSVVVSPVVSAVSSVVLSEPQPASSAAVRVRDSRMEIALFINHYSFTYVCCLVPRP